MKFIGYWMESLLDEEMPLPQELVDEYPESKRRFVCKYLSSGRVFENYRGMSWCRFHCDVNDREMGHREFTDGEWVWPEGLVHYVQAHGVVLPDDFVSFANRTQDSRPPESVDDHSESLDRSTCLKYWIEWSRKRRSISVRRQLATAIAAARAAEATLVEKMVGEILLRETEGRDKCVLAKCSRRALVGCRICARHAITESELRSRTEDLYVLPRRIGCDL